MTKQAVIVLLLLFFGSLSVAGELYRYERVDGSVVITDDPGKVPVAQRDRSRVSEGPVSQEHKAPLAIVVPRSAPYEHRDACQVQIEDNLRACRTYLQDGIPRSDGKTDPAIYQAFLIRVCSHPLIKENLTGSEKEKVRDLSLAAREAEKGMQKKDLYEAEAMSNYFFSPCTAGQEKVYSRRELNELGNELQQRWDGMASALARNDIERAVEYYLPPVQDVWRQQFKAFPGDGLQKMAHDLLASRIVVERVEGGGRAVCHLLTQRDGQEYSFQLIFVSGLGGEWQIYSY